jgi:hypothetical protein
MTSTLIPGFFGITHISSADKKLGGWLDITLAAIRFLFQNTHARVSRNLGSGKRTELAVGRGRASPKRALV